MHNYSMKYLATLLFSVFFLVSCSGRADITDSAETAAETPDTVVLDSATETAEDSDNEPDEEVEAAEEEAGSTGDTAGIEQENVKLVVANQATAGQIVVKLVATSRDGWLSVHKSKEDGGILLDSIGEARVDSGDSEDVVIDLWEAPYADEKLWVLLHIDAGERGEYEFPGEDAAVKKNGETMARSFVVQAFETDEEDE